MDQELNDIKAAVNLVEYAASQGYWVDKAKSCRRTTVMRHDNNDKIVLSRGSKWWIYFSTRDDKDNGTIIDFIQKRQGQNIGQIKQQLRAWLGRPEPQRVEHKFKALTNAKRDREAVRRYIQSTTPITDTAYLKSRHIPPEVIFGPRFDGTIRQDRRGNTVFLHRNTTGFCGAELKNVGFTGCPKDSLKGIWHSRLYEQDNRLVLCESGIDNLSYHVLHGDPNDRYISLAGNFSPEQQQIVKRAIDKMPPQSCIVAAFDNDREGHKYSETIESMVPPDKIFQRDIPISKDWNDDLKATRENNNPAQIQRPSMQRC